MHELIIPPTPHEQHEVTQEGFAFDHTALKKKLEQRMHEVEILSATHEQIKLFNKRTISMAKYLFDIKNSLGSNPRSLEETIHLLDKDYWHEFFEDINLVHLVSADQLSQMREQVDQNPSMSFTEDVVMNLIGNIWENRNLVFADKIKSVLNNLSSSYKSNKGHGINAKIVIPANGRAFNWDICNCLDDLRIAARQIFNLPVQLLSCRTIIHHGKCIDDWIPVDGDLMRFKVFNNGNIHVWLSHDLLVRFNEILNLVQPTALGDKPAKKKALSYQIEMKSVMFNNQEVEVFKELVDPILRSGQSYGIYKMDLESAERMVNKFHSNILSVSSTKGVIEGKDPVIYTLNDSKRITFIYEMFLGGFEQKS